MSDCDGIEIRLGLAVDEHVSHAVHLNDGLLVDDSIRERVVESDTDTLCVCTGHAVPDCVRHRVRFCVLLLECVRDGVVGERSLDGDIIGGTVVVAFVAGVVVPELHDVRYQIPAGIAVADHECHGVAQLVWENVRLRDRLEHVLAFVVAERVRLCALHCYARGVKVRGLLVVRSIFEHRDGVDHFDGVDDANGDADGVHYAFENSDAYRLADTDVYSHADELAVRDPVTGRDAVKDAVATARVVPAAPRRLRATADQNGVADSHRSG